MSDDNTEYNYDFEALPEALRTNFATAEIHPLTQVQTEAADKLLKYFDEEEGSQGCVLVLPAGKSAEVVPLIPYILRTHSAMLLVTTPKAVKDYTKAATGKDAMLIKQGVLNADTFLHPKVCEIKDLFAVDDTEGRLQATDCDLAIANISKMMQPLSEVEEGETEEEKKKNRLSYMIAPPSYLPVDNLDLLIVDGAARLASNADFPSYLPELEYEAREINEDLRIVYVVSGCTSKASVVKILGRARAEGKTEEEDPEGLTAEEIDARILVCCDSLPKPKPRVKKTTKVDGDVAAPSPSFAVDDDDDESSAKRTKVDDGDAAAVDDSQSAITHHSVSANMF